MTYNVYCDGSTRANGSENSVGAWAYVIVNAALGAMVADDYGAERGTTNQRMELQAAIQGIQGALAMCAAGDIINVYTDSAYLHNCYNQKWYEGWQKNGWKNSKRAAVANKDLWEQLIPYFEKFEIDFYKVKGHSGQNSHEKWNVYVDDLAQTASSRLKEVICSEDSRN